MTSDRTRGGAFLAAAVATSGVKEATRRAGRKRLLYSRYLGWSRVSSDWDPAPIPSALERVVHSSLIGASPYGYRLAQPGGGEVRKLLGERVPGGPLDNAAFHTAVLESGLPGQTTVALIEAKNIRQWVYPRTQEMFQLLNKAVSLQSAHPDLRFAPVLVCRRINPITASMARQVGFHVIETKTQYVRPVVVIDDERRRKFDEVSLELGFNLTAHDQEVAAMTRQFTTTLPQRIDDVAERWRLFADHPDVPDVVAELRDDEISGERRHEALGELARAVQDVSGEDVSWASTEHL